MTAGTAILIVGIGAGAVYLLLRSQQQQQAQVAAAAAAAAPAPAAGGISGLASRVVNQWRGDPLGIKNAQAVARGVAGVVSSGISEIKSFF